MSLNTILLMPLMIAGGMYALSPVLRWVDAPRKIANAYWLTAASACLLWLLEVAVYILGSIGTAFSH